MLAHPIPNPSIILDVSGPWKSTVLLLLHYTDNIFIICLFVAELPVIFWQTVISNKHCV